jgi:cyclic beta-1,2-glucan synthetase
MSYTRIYNESVIPSHRISAEYRVFRSVLGFYRSAEHAEEALHAARKNHFRRAAAVHRAEDGRLKFFHAGLAPRDRAAFGIVVALVVALLSEILRTRLWALVLLALSGFLITWFGTLWLGFGIKRGFLRHYSRFVLPGESLVVVQATEENTPDVIAVLGHIAHPSVFAIRPGLRFTSSTQMDGKLREPVTMASLPDWAAELGASHELESSTRSRPLLPILRECEVAIERARAGLAEAARLEYGITNAAEWLLDNAYLIRSHIAEIRHNLPDNHNKILPVLVDTNCPVRLRVYHLAAELVDCTGHRLAPEGIVSFLDAYQHHLPLTIAELWVFPLMLRLVLLERLRRLSEVASLRQHQKELADFWADRLMNAAYHGPEQFEGIITELDRDSDELTPHFIARLGEHLNKEEAALAPIQKWIEEKTEAHLADIVRSEHTKEANDLMSISSAIGSLRQLSELRYAKIVEAVSRVEAVLREDPAGIHARSDFTTRDRCRRVVEETARQSKTPEWAVARLVVELAGRAPRGSPHQCAAYYLLDEGLSELERCVKRRVPWRERQLRSLYRHPTLSYLGGVAALTTGIASAFLSAAYTGGAVSPAMLLLLGTLALFPASELAIYLLQMWLTWVLPPRVLSKMSFEEGIPDDCRTLVVVPMMLLTPDSIRGEIEKLEVRYLANPGANLHFSLLSDFTDAEEPEMSEDDNLLGLAAKGIEDLNARYGKGTFILFHRPRVWCETERRWIGWERKRGKLEELNRFLNGEECGIFVHAGSLPGGIRYLITLDADTQLPHGTARRLIETISHPLNRVELTDNERKRVRGYTIIQPRVSITLPSATATRFARLFTDARGSDPYCQAVSDVYQDLFGEAIYHGKAIYDVRAFHKILSGRFPQQRLLSHDLIEGAHVGVGLATDVELFEDFPYDYMGYSKREHRWIRGDWQIASWIFPRVPAGERPGLAPNPLTLINRWKIFDNLRRSLLPAASLMLLLSSWSFHAAPMAASALVALVLLVPLFLQLLRRLVQRWRGDAGAWREASSDLNRAVVRAAFLPHQAYLVSDAIIRACYRLRVSKRHLLEWQTVEMSRLSSLSHLDAFRVQFFLISALAAAFLLALTTRGIFWEPAWTPFLLLWVAAPAVQHWIGWQRRGLRVLERIEVDDQRYLRRVARETWRYFDDLVGPQHNWLPPDNSQEALCVEVADRTSPTDIGMWLMSAVSALDLGFLTPEQMVDRCTATIGTLERLERYEGHIFNWYNTRTLEPLPPKYVSTVDSGNLIASLWVLAQATQELKAQPQLDARALRGLTDTLSVIMKRFPPDHTTAISLEALRELFQEKSAGIEIMERIRLAAEPARKLTKSLQWSVSDIDERAYWFTRLEQQVESWIQYFDRYLRWVDVLSAPPDEFLQPLGIGAILARSDVLSHFPSWSELAGGETGILWDILRDSGIEDGLPANLIAWMADLRAEYEKVREASKALLGRTKRLSERSEDFAATMDMRFLYDSDRSLFAIGYQAGGPLNFAAHYDLLASEARLSSLVAIAKDDVPVNHWLALRRPYTSSNGHVLLSWGGTMFEYLMPLLFTRSFRNSLLENACAAAVKCQVEYARDRGVPWGISECAYSALDIHKIYQYRAFGVPSLGLKRGLEEDLVVAPYATALALLVDPVESIKNLRRLEKAGMYGRMGFYESLDYARQQERHGGKGVIVYTYMAHHQGMSLMAINNVFNRGIMRQRFHADHRVKAVEPLLFERIPPTPSMLAHSPSDHVAMRLVSGPSEPAYHVFDEDTRIPRVLLLGNGQYALMITNAGAGYSRWGGFDITRWRSDSTCDNWGMFFYLRDKESNKLWSATHQPLNVKDPGYTVIFSPDRAEFRRRQLGIESHVEVTVSPEDDAEIRRITLINHGSRDRKLELTSAAELSLAPHDTDRVHPAFNKLFIQTEARPDLQALIAWRRLRSTDDPPIWAAQLITESPAGDGSFEYETDRARFLGRGQNYRHPAMSVQETGGYVLDPMFVIQRSFSLEPREQRQITFITIAARSREELLFLIAKYRDPNNCSRAFELAWSHAQLEYRYLGIQSDAAFRFGELASHLLYPNIRLRAPVERLRQNTLGQSKLWAYGISGDLPIAAVAVADSQGISLVREVLAAHTYWRLRGFKADLVILNREPASYDQPLHHQLLRLVEAHSSHTGTDQPGGVFLRKADQMPEEDLNLILTVARVTLGTVRGSLSSQLSYPSREIPLPLPPPLQVKNPEEQPSAPLPFLELPYFNGLGGFTADGREYAIYLGPNVSTPLPWINVMANPAFGALVSESGSGCCWYGNSQSNRLTPWNNDPISDASTEAIYIRDEDSGSFWTPTPLPKRELDAYRARHGQGYTEFEHNSHALEQTLLTFVPVHTEGADPVRIQRLRIKNTSSHRRRLSVTSYSELVLGTHHEVTQTHIISSWDEAAKALFARNPYHPDYGGRVAFAAMAPEAVSHTGDRTLFLGRNGSADIPEALLRGALSNRTGPGLDPCAALQTKFELGPGEEKIVILVLGQADDPEHARRLISSYCSAETVEQELAQTRKWWDELLTTIQVKTPVLSVDLLMNRWLLYQTLSCRIWGRSALYQSSGAYGFRDQLQDALAVVYSAPEIAREMILRAASRQFVEGDVQHWWHPPSGEGIRSRCSDDLLWLPFAVCHYVDVTSDTGILDATTTFIEGPQLKEDEREAYFQPAVSIEYATLFEHCRRAIEKGTTQGPHGLPLIGTGDWNDGLNSVGDEGKGESVWLAWFLVDVLKKFAGLCDSRGEEELASGYRESARSLSETVERTSWDGKWYRRAYFDDGTPLGSRQNEEACIDSLPQSWSVISGAGNAERAEQAMRSVDERLIRRKEKLVLLCTPPFDHSTPHPGYIMGYPPGVRENGGQYTHAAVWVAMAFARMGDGGSAVEVLQMLNPIEHSRTPEDCATYRTEPYVVAADIYSLESQMGRGGWTCYTGSAGWMYRVWLEEVLGFKLRGDRLSIEPVLPENWPGYVLTFRYGRTEYRIEVENGGEPSKQEIRLQDDRNSHTIHIYTGRQTSLNEGLTSSPPSVVV